MHCYHHRQFFSCLALSQDLKTVLQTHCRDCKESWRILVFLGVCSWILARIVLALVWVYGLLEDGQLRCLKCLPLENVCTFYHHNRMVLVQVCKVDKVLALVCKVQGQVCRVDIVQGCKVQGLVYMA